MLHQVEMEIERLKHVRSVWDTMLRVLDENAVNPPNSAGSAGRAMGEGVDLVEAGGTLQERGPRLTPLEWEQVANVPFRRLPRSGRRGRRSRSSPRSGGR